MWRFLYKQVMKINNQIYIKFNNSYERKKYIQNMILLNY